MKTFTSTLRIGACLLFALALSLTANAQIFVANKGLGTISKFNRDGSLVTANLVTGLSSPYGIAVSGGFLYVANEGSGTIGKYTTAGVTVNASLISGLNGPRGIAVSGTDLYVANAGGAGTVEKFTTSGAPQAFTPIVGGFAGSIPTAVAVSGTDLYVSFTGNSPRIGKYTTAGGVVAAPLITFPAGTQPLGIAIDGTDLYVVRCDIPGTVEKYTTLGTFVSGLVTSLAVPIGIAVHGGELFVTALGNSPGAATIGQYGTGGFVVNSSLVSGMHSPHGIAVQCDLIYDPYCFTTLAGAPRVFGTLNGIGSAARLNEPWGVAVDGAGTVYVADTQNHIIRRITAGGVVSIIAGNPGFAGFADGTDGVIGGSARFNRPTGVALNSAGTVLYVADYNNHAIRKIDLTQLPLTTATYVTTLAGNGTSGKDDGFGSAARFNNPFGVAVDITGGVWVTDQNNQTIRVVVGGAVTTYAGDSSTTGNGYVNGPRLGGAKFNTPRGIAVDSSGNVYVADSGNFVVRKITASSGLVSTLAGDPTIPYLAGCVDGPGSSARFSQVSAMSPFGGPTGVAVDSLGNVYVTDAGNHVIRRINQNLLPTDPNFVTTLAGSPTSPAYDQAAIFQYFSFGTLPPLSGSADGTGRAAQFYFPGGVAVDATGKLYVADTLNHLIRVSCQCDPAKVKIGLYAGLTIEGKIGCQYRIDYTTFLNPNPSLTIWTTLTTITLSSSSFLYVDTTVVSGNRFYRVVPL